MCVCVHCVCKYTRKHVCMQYLSAKQQVQQCDLGFKRGESYMGEFGVSEGKGETL